MEIEPTYEDSYYTETQHDKSSEEPSDAEEDIPSDHSPQQAQESDKEEEKRSASPVQYKYVPKKKNPPPKEKSPPKREKTPEKEKTPERRAQRRRKERVVREKSVSEMSVQEIQYKKYREKEELRKRKRSPPKGDSPPRLAVRAKPSEQLPELDPYLDAADLELEKARRKFEKA
jgi:hypothetical protein